MGGEKNLLVCRAKEIPLSPFIGERKESAGPLTKSFENIKEATGSKRDPVFVI